MIKTLGLESQSRSRRNRAGLAGLVGWWSLTLCGCSTLSHYTPTQSGKLSDYSALTSDKFHVNRGLGIQQNLSRTSTPEAMERVDSFYIEPVQWLVDADSRAGRDPAYQCALTAQLEAAFREQLGTIRPIVAEPGPRTARVRGVITDARLSRPYSNTVLLAAGAVGSAFGVPIPLGPTFFGGGCVEAEILDPDNHQMAAITCASGGGPIDFLGYFNRPSHARKAMRRAAQELGETLAL